MPLKPLSAPKNVILKIKGFILMSMVSSVLFSALIFLNLLQTLSLVLKIFSDSLFRRFNRFTANLWWGCCDKVAVNLYKINFIYTGDNPPEAENAIVVLNHQEMADITVLFNLARRKQRLGDLKWFVKDILKYVPGIGWGMLFLDCLFVKRNWTEDKAYISSVFEKINRYKIPIWLMTFAEGTRVKPHKLEKSKEFALKNGLKPLRHLLTPRTKGFVASVKALREHAGVVYDITIGYEVGVPTLGDWVKGYVDRVHVHVRSYSIKLLPETDEALSQWLFNIFAEKDELLEYFYNNGVFPENA